MNCATTYSHLNGEGVWQGLSLRQWALDIFDAPKIKVGQEPTKTIHTHVENELIRSGWGTDVSIDPGVGLTVYARKRDLAFQVQTGNISRYTYDLLKFQYLYEKRDIQSGALAIPTKPAAQAIGSNIANAERVIKELAIFDRIITIPLLVIAFE